jgi:hypothetical protein
MLKNHPKAHQLFDAICNNCPTLVVATEGNILLLQRLHKAHFALPIIGLSPVIFTEKKEIKAQQRGCSVIPTHLRKKMEVLYVGKGFSLLPPVIFFLICPGKVNGYHVGVVDHILSHLQCRFNFSMKLFNYVISI